MQSTLLLKLAKLRKKEAKGRLCFIGGLITPLVLQHSLLRKNAKIKVLCSATTLYARA